MLRSHTLLREMKPGGGGMGHDGCNALGFGDGRKGVTGWARRVGSGR